MNNQSDTLSITSKRALDIREILNLPVDNCSEHCEEIFLYNLGYSSMDKEPLLVELPRTFDEYYEKICDKNTRYDYRKAVKAGLTLSREYDVSKINDEILDIWHSQSDSDHRDEEFRYQKDENGKYEYNYSTRQRTCQTFTDTWVEHDYSKFTCFNHCVDFWVVRKEDKIIGMAEITRCGGHAVVTSLLTHAEYLDTGVSKFLFIEMIKNYISFGMKYLSYGFKEFYQTNKRHFVKGLGFNAILEI